MAINEEHLRSMIKETLTPLGWWSLDAEELLMLTMATETHLGEYLEQEGGPASGIYQIEPETEHDIHMNYLAYREEKANKVYSYMSMMGNNLKYNLPYQTILARIHYMRVKEALPARDDVEAMAKYHKKYWNTEKGKATVEKTVEKYNYYIEG